MNLRKQTDREQRLSGRFTQTICIFSLAIYIFYIWYGWSIDRYEVSIVCSIYMLGSLVALLLNLRGHFGIAKTLIIANAAASVVFSYQTFTIGYSILMFFFPLALYIIYLFDFKKEAKWLAIAALFTTGIFIINFLLPRFAYLKVELSEKAANQIGHVHEGMAILITGFLLIVSIRNKNRINKELREKNNTIAATLSQLSEARDQLIQTEKMASLGLLTADISHEIYNPLNFMAGGLENLRALKDKSGNKEIDESFVVFEEGIARISKIVNSLNHFNYYSNTNSQSCDLHFIIENCLTILTNKLNKGIQISKVYVGDATVKGNSGQLHQVFLNILANAIHVIPYGGTIDIRTEMNRNMRIVCVSVRDYGPGISQEARKRIFDPFFTAEEPEAGAGLGLSISHRIIRNHQGNIEVLSEGNEGTEFRIALPVQVR